MWESLMKCKTVNTVQEMQSIAKSYSGSKVGFVPTMGALHAGHLSLVERAKKECDVVIVSIFVNPTQFNNPEDLKTYPNRIADDLKILQDHSVDYLFLPTPEEIYPNGYHYKVHEDDWSMGLCGATRPGHFDGVLTVLIKLFNLVKPTKVYMGLKDYQQWKVVKGMADDFFMDVDVVGAPTVRSEEGLALSSRNLKLTQDQKQIAIQFAQILASPKPLAEIRQNLEALDLKIDYLEERWGRRFAAVFVGDVRLIDNIEVNVEKSDGTDLTERALQNNKKIKLDSSVALMNLDISQGETHV